MGQRSPPTITIQFFWLKLIEACACLCYPLAPVKLLLLMFAASRQAERGAESGGMPWAVARDEYDRSRDLLVEKVMSSFLITLQQSLT